MANQYPNILERATESFQDYWKYPMWRAIAISSCPKIERKHKDCFSYFSYLKTYQIIQFVKECFPFQPMKIPEFATQSASSRLINLDKKFCQIGNLSKRRSNTYSLTK